MISPQNIAVRIQRDWYADCSSRGWAWICLLSEYSLGTCDPVTLVVVFLETLTTR